MSILPDRSALVADRLGIFLEVVAQRLSDWCMKRLVSLARDSKEISRWSKRVRWNSSLSNLQGPRCLLLLVKNSMAVISGRGEVVPGGTPLRWDLTNGGLTDSTCHKNPTRSMHTISLDPFANPQYTVVWFENYGASQETHGIQRSRLSKSTRLSFHIMKRSIKI